MQMGFKSSNNEITHVLLVHEQALMRAALRMLINSHAGFAVLGETGSISEALRLSGQQPTIAVINLSSPAQFQGVQGLLKLIQHARVILLADQSVLETHCHTLGQAIKAGLSGIVFCEDSAESLLNALERVRAGGLWLDSPTLARALGKLLRNNHVQKTDPDALWLGQLTPREREIVTLLSEGKKNKQIAAGLSISEATVRHYLTSIFGKLGVSDRMELAVYACRSSLLQPATQPATPLPQTNSRH